MHKRLLPTLLLVAGLPFLTAGSCATTSEPRVEVREVKIPVPTPCVSDKTPEPGSYPDTADALRNASPGGVIRILRAANLLMHQRLDEIEPVLESCRVSTGR